MSLVDDIARQVAQLPPELQQEVAEFIHSLVEKKTQTTSKEPSQLDLSWRGALEDLRDRYTSVELQHETLKLWDELTNPKDEQCICLIPM